MVPKFYCALIIFILCFSLKLKAQLKLDSISVNLHQYGLRNAASALFVHFDKNLYTNNDQVWFTGYLLNNVVNLDDYHTAYISLVNNLDSSVVLQDKFLIDNGFSFGSLTLPDSLPSGSYRFVVNTNIKIDGKPDGEFTQPITVKSKTVNNLVPNISIFKRYDEKTRNGIALVQILSSENRFVENAEIKYSIGRQKIIKTGIAKSSVIGELMIEYQADEITSENNLLLVSIKKGKDIRYIKYELPIQNSKKYSIQFYPESGYLVNNLISNVGFEIKDLDGSVVKAKAVLFENDQPKDTISSNSTGIGSFLIQPNALKQYYVKLLSDDGQDQKYFLPKAINDGLIINASSVVANEQLRIQLQSSTNKRVHILVHDFSNVLLASSLVVESKKIQNVRLDLGVVPVGLYTITVLDSMYKPIAERIFFAHYNQINHLSIQTNKEEFGTREKVELNLKAFGNDTTSLAGLVSISCVQANRLLPSNEINIVDYYFLQKELAKLPPHPLGNKISDEEYLNNVLLVKGWRRYKWPLEKQSDFNLEKLKSSIEYYGVISKGKKALKTPVTLNIIAGSNVGTISSDSTGIFHIPIDNLISSNQGKVWVSIIENNYLQYQVKINDPANEIKALVMAQSFQPDFNKMVAVNDVSQDVNPSTGITLKEVVIKSKNDIDISFARNGFANKCGDYVCKFNILNCPNHYGDSYNNPPQKGLVYAVGSGVTRMYMGCTIQEARPNLQIIKGISLAKEFYVSDILNREEPINFATVYWNYQAALKDNEATNVTFNTGDLTGRFKIVIQGVTKTGVVYAEKYITIKNP